MVPKIGLEPTTYALRVRCTTNCATSAYESILNDFKKNASKTFTCTNLNLLFPFLGIH